MIFVSFWYLHVLYVNTWVLTHPRIFCLPVRWLYVPVYVERKHEEDPSYEAACDVSELMSCSRVRQLPSKKCFQNISGSNHFETHTHQRRMITKPFSLTSLPTHARTHARQRRMRAKQVYWRSLSNALTRAFLALPRPPLPPPPRHT